MFILANFVSALAKVIDYGLTIYMWVIIARALISWVNPDPYNPIVQFLYRITEPVLTPIRRLIPIYKIGIDISPIIVIMIIFFLQNFLVISLLQLAHSLK
ncbi:MAG: YggT family protein [Nitrospirae bacterium]|nr:YggT family protein [Nitrospirota bacterium]